MNDNPGKSTRPQYKGAESASYRRLAGGFDETVDSDNIWLISLSDILSLLLVFFIMFLVMTKGSVAVEKARPVEDQSHMLPVIEVDQKQGELTETVRDEIKSGMDHLDLGDDISILSTDREIIITIREKVTFNPGEAGLLNGFGPVLENIAATIHKYPSLHAEITGHTDNVPIHTPLYPSNWELSVARATSVLKYFINTCSIDPSRLSIKGNADQKPVVPNDTPENRAQNRRVEIRLKHTGDGDSL